MDGGKIMILPKTCTAAEARNNLGTISKESDPTVILSNSKPVAAIVPYELFKEMHGLLMNKKRDLAIKKALEEKGIDYE